MLPVPFYNTLVDGTYNAVGQLCVENWLLGVTGELVSLCDWLQLCDVVNRSVPPAWAVVGFRTPCQYINIANSSTQYSPHHTPISHLWIAWTYSESLCCCAFKVTPIAVSGTERVSGQNWAHFEFGRNICSNKNNSKISADEMEGKPVQIPGDEQPRWGLIFPLSCVCLGFCRQCQYLSKLHLNQLTL
jgi:hypothetical protein